MHDLHLLGTTICAETWHSVYRTNPVLKCLTQLLDYKNTHADHFAIAEALMSD